MLRAETTLTSRVGALPDTYHFIDEGFLSDTIDMQGILFGASEYIKDGLLPLTEWLGHSPWSSRMISILDDIWHNTSIETKFGKIPSTNVELNGEMLQVLSRIYWMSGDQKYLEWAIRLGDYYLFENHPTESFSSLRLRDHGCEIISGLCELYAVLHFSNVEKYEKYRPGIHLMLDRILEVGRNEDGLFYNVVNPQDGEVIDSGVADNFGYSLNGFYTVYQLDSVEAYREATVKALSILGEKYRDFSWEGTSSDGYADAIEGALNLFNREIDAPVASWLDSEVQVMWNKQQPNGIIEGWHGDGNFARTTLMYCLWKSRGVHAVPFADNLELSATTDGDTIWVSAKVANDWSGKLVFDSPRHKTHMNLPYDWPRINQFQEWYCVEDDRRYVVVDDDGGSKMMAAQHLREGFQVDIAADEPLHFKIFPLL